jgi:hypothetical protein
MKQSASRRELHHQLTKWEEGEIDVASIKAWAEEILDTDTWQTFIDDWTQEDEESVSLEILRTLEMADINLLTPEDVPVLKELLNVDDLKTFHAQKDAHFQQVNYAKRTQELAHVPFYKKATR